MDLVRDDVRVGITQIQLEQVCSASRTRSTWILTSPIFFFQDTAKSIFDARRRCTQVDLNRAGSGLMEIVSEPDMRSVSSHVETLDFVQCFFRSPEEAGEYVRTLQAMLRAVGASDGSMELVSMSSMCPLQCDDVCQGSLRCDVNVSVNKHGRPPGTRCEIKNLNSVKFMMVAISASLLVYFPTTGRDMVP